MVVVTFIVVSWGRIAQLGPSDGDEETFFLACVGGDVSGLSTRGWPLAFCGILLLAGCSVPLGGGPCPHGAAVMPREEPGWGLGPWVLVLPLPLFTR